MRCPNRLVAAARRLARRYAALPAGTPEPPEATIRLALPTVMQDGVCGVDVDVDLVAVDLAKAALRPPAAATRSHRMSFMNRNVIYSDLLDGPECVPEALRPTIRESGVA